MLSTARERDFSRKRMEEPGTEGWGLLVEGVFFVGALIFCCGWELFYCDVL